MLCLCMPRECVGNRGISPLILNIGTKSGEWSVPRPGYFTPSEKEPSVHDEEDTGWAPDKYPAP